MMAVTLDLFRLKTGARINSDEAYRIARDHLMLDFRSFERAHSTHVRDYHFAVAELRNSMNSFHNNDFLAGFSSLEKASYCAHTALREVTLFEDKILLTRIQILFALHENKFFNGNECDNPRLQSRCRVLFNDLCQTSHVLDAIHHELGKHSVLSFLSIPHSHSAERIVLEEIHALNHFFGKYIGTTFLIYDHGNQITHWKTMKPLKLARSHHSPEHPIQCIAALGDELYTADSRGLHIWKIRSNSLFATFHIDPVSEIKCMLEHDNQLITGSYDGAVRIWDLLIPGNYKRLDIVSGVIVLKILRGRLYVATHDRKVRCIDLDTYQQLECYECEHECLDFTLVGSTLYISALLNDLHLWDTVTQVKIDQIEVPCVNIVYMHDNLLFGVDTFRTNIIVYDLVHCNVIITLEETAISMYVWGNTLVVENDSICLWDIITHGKVRVIETKDGVKDVVVSDNRLFYSDGNCVRMYLI